MKKLLITSLVLAGVCAPALAEETSIEVVVPANIAEPAVAEAYKAELEKAIKVVCRKAANPPIGLGYYTMLDCVEETTKQVAADDPTGLLAASIGQPRTVVLAGQTAN